MKYTKPVIVAQNEKAKVVGINPCPRANTAMCGCLGGGKKV